MLDHVTIGVSDTEQSKKFYDRALRPLGSRAYTPKANGSRAMASVQKPSSGSDGARRLQTGAHIAFAAPDRATVDRFYEEAVAAGGRDNGRPGIRPNYHPNYYGAFVLDPDGHNIEAVCHSPQG